MWFRRIAIGIAAIGVLGFVGFNLFKPQIATFVFNRVVEQNVGVDRSASLPEGLHVYLCGTGAPMPDANRAGPCVGVLAGDRAFIFDVGSGAMRKLGAMGFPTGRVETTYLTHLHSDHIDGLGEMMLLAWIGGNRSEPVPIAGPVGTEEVVAGFNAAYRIDSGYRVAHHGTEVANPNGFGGIAREIKIPPGPGGRLVVLEDGDLKITAIRVSHAPIEPAFGYRIDYKGRAVAISGDTIYDPGFVAASKGADLMLHEALDPDMVSKMGATFGLRGQANGETIFEDILDYHASPEEAARAAQAAGVDHLVLYHLVPPLPVRLIESMFLGDADKEFDGPITIGQDGLIFSMPADTDKIEITKGF